MDYGESRDVIITAVGAVNITAEIDGKCIGVNGFVIPISNLNATNYTLSVTAVPDKNHISVTKTANIKVNKINSSLTVNNVNMDYGDSVNVDVVTDGAMAISAKIDNENVSVDGFAIPISGLDAGTYNLTVTTIPDDNHNPVTEIATITVNKINSSINVSDTVVNYGDSVSVDVTTEGAIGIAAKINDANAIVFNNSIEIPILNAGVHNLTVITIPDGNHLEVNKTVTITVNKVNSTVGINNIVLVIGNSTNITVATEGAIGIAAKINDANATVFSNSIEIPILDLGNYTLTVTTVPDGNHNPVTKTVNLTIKKPDSILTIEDIVFEYNSVGSTAMSFEGATGVNAKIINQPDVHIEIKDDEIIIGSTLKPGTYTLEVTTIPDDDHDPVTRIVNITVEKLESKLTVGDIAFDYNGVGSAAVSFEGASGVAAEVVGQPNAAVSVKGNTVTVSGLDAGTYTLAVTTVSDDVHNPVTKTATITVNKLKTQIDANAITTTYNINKELVITLTGSQNNPLSGVKLSVNLNGAKTFTTDKNGQIKVSTNALVPKSYTAAIAFEGNANYAKSTKSVKLTVKKANSKIIAGKKSFKVKVKSKKYTITLKDNVGKVIKKAKVSLKVKGKTYKATTNSKGKATFKITKLTKKGKFNAVVAFKGNAYYSKVTKKVKITVK